MEEKKSQAENNILDFLIVATYRQWHKISETTPVQMITEQQLELNQQLFLDMNNYCGSGYSQTEDVFLFGSIWGRSLSTEHDSLISLKVVFFLSPPSMSPSSFVLSCGHAVPNETDLYQFVCFFLFFLDFCKSDISCLTCSGIFQRAATKSSFGPVSIQIHA